MSDDERESRDRLPKLREFGGDAADYLDADEGYQRYARRHYKGGGLDKRAQAKGLLRHAAPPELSALGRCGNPPGGCHRSLSGMH